MRTAMARRSKTDSSLLQSRLEPAGGLQMGRRKTESVLDKLQPTDRRRSIDVKAFMPQRVNASISKRYDIDNREVGAGGHGKVYKAQDRITPGRQVAIKKVVTLDTAKKQQFLKEAKIMKDLDHPNICKLLETYEQGRYMFFVMEYCEGRDVFDRIMDNSLLPEAASADIVRQAASALKYAHTRGIAHRDLKPENMCFCNNDSNHVKVIDWGFGIYFGLARMSSAVGSFTYAAPEVMQADDMEGYTSSCDLWSLGVVTYVMLCGKPPFWGSREEQLRKMKAESFPMQDASWQQVSREAKEVIRALLRHKPEKRMSIDAMLAHPWLNNRSGHLDQRMAAQVLKNMRQFSSAPQLFSICAASVARQLDHRSLRDVHSVFCEMDTNGDGVLELCEVMAGFEKTFGKGSDELRDVDEIFRHIDLDGSGAVDYTEFCAAGIGDRISTEESWAAFKAFDVTDDDGHITKDEMVRVLQNADVNKAWTREVCEDVALEIFDRFDRDGDGTIDFSEWMGLVCGSAGQGGRRRVPEPAESRGPPARIDGRRGEGRPGGPPPGTGQRAAASQGEPVGETAKRVLTCEIDAGTQPPQVLLMQSWSACQPAPCLACLAPGGDARERCSVM